MSGSSSFASLLMCDRYSSAGWLYGHQGAINCVALTTNCQYLASGGMLFWMCNAQKKADNNKASDGVKIWDVRTRAELVPPVQGQAIRGPVSCMVWIQQSDPSKEILCYATALGYLVLWIHSEKRGFEQLFARAGTEIVSMASNGSSADSARIVLGMRDRVVQVHRVDSRGQLHPVFSVQLNVTVPRSVAFVDNTANNVYVFGIFNGKMCAFPPFLLQILMTLPDISSMERMERSSRRTRLVKYCERKRPRPGLLLIRKKEGAQQFQQERTDSSIYINAHMFEHFPPVPRETVIHYQNRCCLVRKVKW
jgi:hypothetical protein